MRPDRPSALRQAGKAAQADRYQGETLNSGNPGASFGRLTERHWALVTALQGLGAMTVRELVRRAGRDVKRVHEDVPVLTRLGLVGREDAGGVPCRSCRSRAVTSALRSAPAGSERQQAPVEGALDEPGRGQHGDVLPGRFATECHGVDGDTPRPRLGHHGRQISIFRIVPVTQH